MRNLVTDLLSGGNAADRRGQKAGHGFVSDESGSMSLFTGYMLVIIFMIGGIGVDLMMHERDRAKLQYTIDRAVLAAADLDQVRDPEEVVREYLEKEGLLEYLTNIEVEEGIGYRVVSAQATREIPTHFMHLSGVDTLQVPASSIAEESVGAIEVSLILDVSGSMNRNNKLPNLKVAAKDFVDQMADNTLDGNLSISIVPYATQVSLPEEMFDEYATSGTNEHSRCINFPGSVFSNTSVNQNTEFQRTMHFDPWYSTDVRPQNAIVGEDSGQRTLPVCESAASREILPFQKDRDVLKNYIDGMFGRGNTSIDVGMKWGTAMLDPGFKPVLTSLIDDGEVNGVFADRPAAFNDGETLKVIVLMTDGQNTQQYYIEDDYREGPSDVWWNEDAQRYSVYVPQYNRFYWPDADEVGADDWQDHAYGNSDRHCDYYSYYGNCRVDYRNENGTATELSFAELWESTPIRRNYFDNFDPWTNSTEWYYGPRNYVGSSTKDSRTYSICDAAKEENVIVYTIAFEAPSQGEYVLKKCASSDGHFYDVAGEEIEDAFTSIASSIRKLRLTQ